MSLRLLLYTMEHSLDVVLPSDYASYFPSSVGFESIKGDSPRHPASIAIQRIPIPKLKCLLLQKPVHLLVAARRRHRRVLLPIYIKAAHA